MCRSVSANTVVVLSPGDDGVYNTDDDPNDGWVLASLMGTQASSCAGRSLWHLVNVRFRRGEQQLEGGDA